MKQLVVIASLVGLVMYVGFVADRDGLRTASPSSGDIRALQEAVEAMDARLDRVVITGWVPALGTVERERILSTLRWKDPTPADEIRELRLLARNGEQFWALRWVLVNSAPATWVQAQTAVSQALALTGNAPSVTVQLEGSTTRTDVQPLVDSALDRLGVRQREPWSDPPAASVAGWSHLLPASPFGVNIQVAARYNPVDGESKVWVAWPALLQEY